MRDNAALVSAAPAAPGHEPLEAHRALVDLARGKTGKIPPEWLATQALRVTEGADFPVQRAALEALIRRWGFARRDQLKLVSRPQGREVLGFYRTAANRAARPYRTLLASIEPTQGSCDCSDYFKSSLGLCKHLLLVIEDLSRRDLLGAARPAAALDRRNGARLGWDPVRPLTGPGDWLDRVRLELSADVPASRLLAVGPLRRWFGTDGSLRSRRLDVPAQRLALCRELLAFLEVDAGGHAGRGSDPALWPLLRLEIDALEAAASCSPTDVELRRSLRGLKQKLYPYQLEGVRRFLATGRLLLADDMGLGKTAQAIACCHVLFGTGRVKRGLVVAPASLKPQWMREWALFSDVPLSLVEGSPAERARVYQQTREGFLLVNYEQVLRDLPLLQRFAPDLVVLDEAQRIKNWAAKTSVHVKSLSARFRLVLTGTPMENRLDELASLVEWIDAQALEPKWRLSPWHTALADGRHEVVGARNLATLRTRLDTCLLRRLRSNVLAQLPPRTDTRLPVPLTAEQQVAHDELIEPIARLVSQAKRRPLTQVEFLRLMNLFASQRIICNGLAQRDFEEIWPSLAAAPEPTEALLRSLCSPKLLELRELIRSVVIEQGRRVVVFSQWRRMLRLAQWATSDVLAQGSARSVFFTGEEGQRRRAQNLVDFHDDPAVRVLFASDAGGVGLNLQRAANCCINLELPWNPAVLEQRIGRIFRNGQKSAVDVYCLVSQTGIEDRIANLVGDKRALFTGLFDGVSDEVGFTSSGSFLSRIEKMVEPISAPGPGSPQRSVADDSDEEATIEESFDSLPPLLESEPLGAASMETPALGGAELGGAVLGDLGALFSRVEVRRGEGGNLTFEAPPEVAASIAAIFGGLARVFGASA